MSEVLLLPVQSYQTGKHQNKTNENRNNQSGKNQTGTGHSWIMSRDLLIAVLTEHILEFFW